MRKALLCAVLNNLCSGGCCIGLSVQCFESLVAIPACFVHLISTESDQDVLLRKNLAYPTPHGLPSSLSPLLLQQDKSSGLNSCSFALKGV